MAARAYVGEFAGGGAVQLCSGAESGGAGYGPNPTRRGEGGLPRVPDGRWRVRAPAGLGVAQGVRQQPAPLGCNDEQQPVTAFVVWGTIEERWLDSRALAWEDSASADGFSKTELVPPSLRRTDGRYDTCWYTVICYCYSR